MAALSEEEIKKYGKPNQSQSQSTSPPSSTNNDNSNTFRCAECNNFHDIGDLFLWSGCNHKYGRECVLFLIQTQLYHKELPLCPAPNCRKLLLETEAELILPEEALLQYLELHRGYQMPPVTPPPPPPSDDMKSNDNATVDLMHHLVDDEKTNNMMTSQSINPLHPHHGALNNKIIDSLNEMETVFGAIIHDPDDDSMADDEAWDDDDDPLLSNGNGDGNRNGNGNRYDNVNGHGVIGTFECIICKETHSNEERFEWTQCSHCYGRECAYGWIIQSLFDRQIPRCMECKGPLDWNEAIMVLQGDELEVFQEIYVSNASMEPKVEPKVNEPSEIEEKIDDKARIKENQSRDKEEEEYKLNIDHDQPKEKKLMPSVLVLPDNNFKALVPVGDDFIDDDEIVLSAKKRKELDDRHLFYCSICKQVISMDGVVENGKFTSLKCQHVSCIKCARHSTLHEMEEVEHIPSCPVCPETITEDDLMEIWGKKKALQLIDDLFKRKSLRVPPYRPDLVAGSVPDSVPESVSESVPGTIPERDESDNVPERDREPEGLREEAPNGVIDHEIRSEPQQDAVPKIDEKKMEQKINDKKEDDDDDEEWGHCLTTDCHRKNRVNGTRLDCTGCGMVWCIRCGVEYHLGQSCKQYQDEMVAEQQKLNQMMYGAVGHEEEQFQALYHDEKWRTCAQCTRVIQKDGGCNHMTCVCGYHFCWLCEQEVDPTNLDAHYEIGICLLNEQDVV